MPEIPPQAVQAAAEALAREWLETQVHSDQTLARKVLEAAAPLIAEHIVGLLGAAVANYPPDIFPSDSDSRDAIGGTAMRHAYANASRMARDAFASDAPARGSEPPHGALTPDPGDVGSTDDPRTVDTPTALRERYAAAMLNDLYEPHEITERANYGGRVFPAVDRILAVRDDELQRLRADLVAARAATGDSAAISAWSKAFDRAQQAEAADERVKALHLRDDSSPHGPWCGTCTTVWPCRTWTALNQPATEETDHG